MQAIEWTLQFIGVLVYGTHSNARTPTCLPTYYLPPTSLQEVVQAIEWTLQFIGMRVYGAHIYIDANLPTYQRTYLPVYLQEVVQAIQRTFSIHWDAGVWCPYTDASWPSYLLWMYLLGSRGSSRINRSYTIW